MFWCLILKYLHYFMFVTLHLLPPYWHWDTFLYITYLLLLYRDFSVFIDFYFSIEDVVWYTFKNLWIFFWSKKKKKKTPQNFNIFIDLIFLFIIVIIFLLFMPQYFSETPFLFAHHKCVDLADSIWSDILELTLSFLNMSNYIIHSI